MSKEKFNWKGLFINEDEGEKASSKKEESKPTFPETPSTPKVSSPVKATSSFTPSASNVTQAKVSNNVLNTIVEMYESGFESLNKPGYDFYEFFKAIKAVGSNDPSIYKMALTMAQSSDASVTKSSLLKEADFYINEIGKVHKQYADQGNSKKNKIINDQKTIKTSLINEISQLEKKLMELQNQVSNKKNELHSLDTNLVSEIAEVDEKIVANDKAKDKILDTIMTVVNGIKTNI